MHDWCSHLEIPRREIPKWFGHQCEGDLLKLAVPSGLLINNICKGVAMCAVIEPNNDSGTINCEFTVNGHTYLKYSSSLVGTYVKDPCFNTIESNTLFLEYFISSDFKYIWEGTNRPSEFQIEISYRGSYPVVKNCGGLFGI